MADAVRFGQIDDPRKRHVVETLVEELEVSDPSTNHISVTVNPVPVEDRFDQIDSPMLDDLYLESEWVNVYPEQDSFQFSTQQYDCDVESFYKKEDGDLAMARSGVVFTCKVTETSEGTTSVSHLTIKVENVFLSEDVDGISVDDGIELSANTLVTW